MFPRGQPLQKASGCPVHISVPHLTSFLLLNKMLTAVCAVDISSLDRGRRGSAVWREGPGTRSTPGEWSSIRRGPEQKVHGPSSTSH